ncbi:MAG: peptide deformylase [Syntrophomonadaceae bacterium]|jgi:peptide deformylase
MAVYQVLKLPDETLRTRSAAVRKINDGVLRVLDNMRDTLYAEEGLGLAAPQIGILKRIIVVDTGEQYIELINPEIIEREGEQTSTEGCLSVPGIIGRVKRSLHVKVSGLNRHGEQITIIGSELLAKALQHEIDHLDGILFIDKAIETRKER